MSWKKGDGCLEVICFGLPSCICIITSVIMALMKYISAIGNYMNSVEPFIDISYTTYAILITLAHITFLCGSIIWIFFVVAIILKINNIAYGKWETLNRADGNTASKKYQVPDETTDGNIIIASKKYQLPKKTSGPKQHQPSGSVNL